MHGIGEHIMSEICGTVVIIAWLFYIYKLIKE